MLNKRTFSALLTVSLLMGLAACGSGGVQVQANGAGEGAQLVSLSLTPTEPMLAQDTDQQFIATGIYSDNTTKDLTDEVTWSSSDTNVATIDTAAAGSIFLAAGAADHRGGRAYAKAMGRTTITAAAGSVSGSTELTVTAATLSSIAVTPASSSVAQGASQQFTAIGTFSDGTTQNLTAAAVWSSSNSGVAAVSNAADSKGLAAALAAGTTTITAVSGSISASASLTVTAPAPVPAPGSTTLSWTAPSQRVDGSPITNLAGYRLYYGTSSGNYTAVQDLGNVTTLNLATLSLGQGTYYFVLTAYDIQNYESGYSTEISRTIQ